MSLIFEWDEDKEEINMRKHGISFKIASKVFLDENRIEIYDKTHSIDEDRFVTIGSIGEILFVVYTERDSRIRMISARLATNREEGYIMVTFELRENTQLDEREKQMLEQAKNVPIVFDSDSPELTKEMEDAFRQARIEKPYKKEAITLYVSLDTIEKARSLGTDYISILENVLDKAMKEYKVS